MPIESAKHERTFMQWPVNKAVYQSVSELEAVQKTIASIANTIAKFEPVVMMTAKEYHSSVRKQLTEKIELWDIPTDDLWCRDSGPVFLLNENQELAASSLNFNGWGNKQPHQNDGKITERLCERLGVKLFNNGLVGEAGGVDFDGSSNLIAHESSWVNKNRNSQDLPEIEELLKQAFGASKVIWAPGVSGEDITDYHIDSLARQSEPSVIFIQMPEQMDPYDPWSRTAFETMEILRNENFEIIDVQSPLTTRVEDDDFVASYPNYYVCNGGVICAQYGDKEADTVARRTLEELYPDHVVIALDIDALGKVGGGIHCATQQQPASKSIWLG